jgi:hypothetical protein
MSPRSNFTKQNIYSGPANLKPSAIPAAITVAVTPAIAAAAAAPPATTATATTASTTPATTASVTPEAAATRRLRPRFIHLQDSPLQIKPVQRGNSLGHVVCRPQLHEPKSPGATGFCVSNYAGGSYLKPIARENLLQALICRVKRQISNV